MEDQLVSKTTVLALTLWTTATVLLGMAWVVMVLDPVGWRWSMMLAATALMMTGVAMMMHIRCHVLRILNLIRATAGLRTSVESARQELHPVP